MTFQSPMSLSAASAFNTGQLFRQLPVQEDLLASLSLSQVYRVMPLASVSMPPAALTLAGIAAAATATPYAATVNTTAEARKFVPRIFFSPSSRAFGRRGGGPHANPKR